MKKLTLAAFGLILAAARMQADTTIPGGTTSNIYTASSAGTYDLLDHTTLTYTGTSEAINATATGTTINIQGDLTASNKGAGILVNNTTGTNLPAFAYTVDVGADGLIQTTSADAIRVKHSGNANNTGPYALSVNNLGNITVLESDAGGLGYDANQGIAIDTKGNTSGNVTDPAAANFYTAGGVINNGSTSNSTATISSKDDVAVQMGSNQTLNNYGAITSTSLINDSSANDIFTSGGSAAKVYDIGRGVEMGSNGDTVNNYGTITGAQHGLDESNDATNLVVNNYGTITGNNGSGIGSDTVVADPTNEVVTNFATGKIIANNAVPGHIIDQQGLASPDSDPDGIDIDGGATIYNYGSVTTTAAATGYDPRGRANAADGISIGGGNVFNYAPTANVAGSGQIISAQNAVTVNNDSEAERTGDTALNLENDGLIQGKNGYAIRSENKPTDSNPAGSDPGGINQDTHLSNDNDTVVNTGVIIGGTAAPDPSQVITLEGGGADTLAYGTLNGVTYYAPGMILPGTTVALTQAMYVDSTGTHVGNARFVDGDGSAIQMGQGNDVLTNTGAIYGTTDGTMTGPAGKAINMEDGDDTVNLEQGSKIIGDIDGGNGSEVAGDTLNLDLDDTQGLKELSTDGTADGTAITYTASASDTFNFASAILDFEHVNALSGKTILTGNSTYVGVTTIGGGSAQARFEQDGTHTGGLAYHVENNGTLAGSGTVTLATAATTVTVDQGGMFAPGSTASTGRFTLVQGSLIMDGNLSFRLDGSTAGVAGGYDQLTFSSGDLGTFALGATSTLSLTLDYAVAIGTQFTLVDVENAATQGVGTFFGLAEGAVFTDDGQAFKISYKGGDGNDIVITAVPEPSTYALLLLSGGLLALAVRRKIRA